MNNSERIREQAGPLQYNFSAFATTPWISSRCPATLVRLRRVRCPHSLAPTFVVLPSMSLGPPLHSLRLRTPAVLLFSASRGLSPSRYAHSMKSLLVTLLIVVAVL